jgi:hypothetical protein
LQADPIGYAGGDTDLRRYCNGDPVNFVDPMGLSIAGDGWNLVRGFLSNLGWDPLQSGAPASFNLPPSDESIEAARNLDNVNIDGKNDRLLDRYGDGHQAGGGSGGERLFTGQAVDVGSTLHTAVDVVAGAVNADVLPAAGDVADNPGSIKNWVFFGAALLPVTSEALIKAAKGEEAIVDGAKTAAKDARAAEGATKGAACGEKGVAEGRFTGSGKHHQNSSGGVGKNPTDGQRALDNSYQVKDTNPDRRVAYDRASGEFVVLDRTGGDEWHGHVRTWDQLTQEQKNTLYNNGITNRKGKPIE